MKPRGAMAWWSRLFVATVAAYIAGFLVEGALGQWDPSRVGWSASFVPLFVEGGLFAFVLGGVGGALLAPLPLFVAPETWVRASRLASTVGPLGLWLLLFQPVPAMWAAGIAGAVVRRLLAR